MSKLSDIVQLIYHSDGKVGAVLIHSDEEYRQIENEWIEHRIEYFSKHGYSPTSLAVARLSLEGVPYEHVIVKMVPVCSCGCLP
jgi:hypothetical protein